jgi:hypothetical protein
MEQNRNHNSSHGVGASADGGDAVMARWLQSAGLQHLAAPLSAAALDHRLLPSLLMQVLPIFTTMCQCLFSPLCFSTFEVVGCNGQGNIWSYSSSILAIRAL